VFCFLQFARFLEENAMALSRRQVLSGLVAAVCYPRITGAEEEKLVAWICSKKVECTKPPAGQSCQAKPAVLISGSPGNDKSTAENNYWAEVGKEMMSGGKLDGLCKGSCRVTTENPVCTMYLNGERKVGSCCSEFNVTCEVTLSNKATLAVSGTGRTRLRARRAARKNALTVAKNAKLRICSIRCVVCD
jgi:hypothetical protein